MPVAGNDDQMNDIQLYPFLLPEKYGISPVKLIGKQPAKNLLPRSPFL